MFHPPVQRHVQGEHHFVTDTLLCHIGFFLTGFSSPQIPFPDRPQIDRIKPIELNQIAKYNLLRIKRGTRKKIRMLLPLFLGPVNNEF
jgi:hypothetical protein